MRVKIGMGFFTNPLHHRNAIIVFNLIWKKCHHKALGKAIITLLMVTSVITGKKGWAGEVFFS